MRTVIESIKKKHCTELGLVKNRFFQFWWSPRGTKTRFFEPPSPKSRMFTLFFRYILAHAQNYWFVLVSANLEEQQNISVKFKIIFAFLLLHNRFFVKVSSCDVCSELFFFWIKIVHVFLKFKLWSFFPAKIAKILVYNMKYQKWYETWFSNFTLFSEFWLNCNCIILTTVLSN